MPEGVDDMKIRFKKNKPVVRNTKVKTDYVCLNGKTLSEQTINDYAQFIPAWDEREELGDDCYLVSCVHPHNHTHNDDPSQGGTPSLMISVGNNKKVIVHCRQAACPDSAILQYFLSRLTGEVKTGTAPVSANNEPPIYIEETLAEARRRIEKENTDWLWKKHLRSLKRRAR